MKPFTIQIKEFTESLVELINKSNLPAYSLINILNNTILEINNVDEQEIKKYYDEQENANNEKESDK